jgi:branched-chain amino acid transport system permease protein
MITLLSHVIVGALVGLLYALIAMGFVIIYRCGKMVNMAQGEIVMLGGFLVWSFARYFGLPLWLSLGSAFAVSVVLGLVINRLIVRPLIGEELFALVMTTIGLMILIRGLVLVIWSPMVHFFPVVFPLAGLKIGPFMLDRGLVIGGGITILMAGAVSWFFNHTRMGLEMTAVAEDHQIALSLGLNVKRSIAISWAVSGVLCTLAAIIFLSGKGMTYLVGDIGLVALPVALFAGMESVGGLVLAGIIIGISTGTAEYFLDPIFQGGVSAVFPFVIMVVVLFIRPSGLFGWKIIERI